MALILCMETASEQCSIVVANEGKIIGQASSSGTFDHTAQLTLLMEACLRDADVRMDRLDAVAVSIGPGSYTSLRTGLSTAKGLCYGLDLPLLPIDSLRIIAAGAIQEQVHSADTLFVPMIDARRMEVYVGVYTAAAEALEEPTALVLTEDSFSSYFERGQHLVFAGNGAAKFVPLTASPHAQFSTVRSHAAFMPALAEQAFQQRAFADLAYVTPVYLKAPNITVPKTLRLES
jgi:tRNA threonylcarbamoyladenosine biosynthesis protein TsaB